MSDMMHFANDEQQIWEWWGLHDVSNNKLEPWCKSWVRNYSFVDIFLIGAGASGGRGATKVVDANGGGGGTGASGGMVTARFALASFPDTVYFCIPQGGIGVSAGNGGAGQQAFMSIKISSAAADLILITSSSQSGNGGAGTASAGAVGSAAGLAVAANAVWSSIAMAWQPRNSVAGGNAGAAGGAGGSITPAGIFSGGAGGAGSSSAANGARAGGDITTIGQVPTVVGGAAGPNDGSDGLWYKDNPFMPWLTTGGAGGGSTNTAGQTGGRGGNGGPGSGGGGGGAGVIAGGRGGDGGPAYMLLMVS